MTRKYSTLELIQCIDSIISKDRALLTVKEKDVLEEIKFLLKEFDAVNISDKRILALRLAMCFMKLLSDSNVVEKVNEAFHHFCKSL